MTNAYAQWFAQIEQEYGEQLADMPLPDGLPEHLAELIEAGDQEAVLFMLKVAWQLGAQAGLSAGVRLAQHGQGPQGQPAPSSGLKA
ncbi:hypothetical protein GCM10017783_04890 [Deinococcus piscis]|uniref:DdrH n=1 Tax=Deinococcus piscis TaxID=394230 RepID=A0ABQ3JZ64_9DEIO|nr:DdrH [Deinococcus piscis]GHF95993.1 hypothetical protein GCM10017783_04890 [Deinococcus piscis]